MRKIPLDTLRTFDKDAISILSPKRLEGYEGSIERHYENLFLAFQSGKRIATLEIYLRNKLDFCLREIEGEDWIKSEKSLCLIKQKTHIPLPALYPHQILSSLMFGELIGLINAYGIKHYMFDLRDFDFRKYHWSNRNYGYINGKKVAFSNIDKNAIVLNLIRNIRNRAFHWENLFKVTKKDNGDIFPRLTHKENNSTIGVMPEMILEFLDDLIDCIGNEVIKECIRKGGC
ncbi:hypothetical protein [Helicobacter brantae]|nr:hypothetical protein [Helicobacter brantae]